MEAHKEPNETEGFVSGDVESASELMDVVEEIRDALDDFKETVKDLINEKSIRQTGLTWMSLEETRGFLKISRKTLFRYRDKKLLTHKIYRHKIYFRSDEVRKLIPNNKIRQNTS